MTTRLLADVGAPDEEIDTPALVVDLDVYEWKLDRMAWYVCVRRGRGEALWPIAARGAVL